MKVIKDNPNVLKKNKNKLSFSRPKQLTSFNVKKVSNECDLIMEEFENTLAIKTQVNHVKTQKLNSSDLKLFSYAKREMGT